MVHLLCRPPNILAQSRVMGARPRRARSARFDFADSWKASRGGETPAEASGECGDVVASDNSDFFPQRRLQEPPTLGQLLDRRTQLLRFLGGETGWRGYAGRRLSVRSLHPFVADVVKRREGHCVDIVRRCLLDAFILFGRLPRGLRRPRLPDVLHETHPLLAQEALDAADGVALAVKKMADAA
jgi:hypothetical protein